MNHWRQLTVGDHVRTVDAYDRIRDGVVAPVPEEWRDESGSAATTRRGDFPKAWIDHGQGPVPWPVSDVHWPGHIETSDPA